MKIYAVISKPVCRFLFFFLSFFLLGYPVLLLANKAHYGISNFGISVTTLEEVFHRVGETTADSIEKR